MGIYVFRENEITGIFLHIKLALTLYFSTVHVLYT